MKALRHRSTFLVDGLRLAVCDFHVPSVSIPTQHLCGIRCANDVDMLTEMIAFASPVASNTDVAGICFALNFHRAYLQAERNRLVMSMNSRGEQYFIRQRCYGAK